MSPAYFVVIGSAHNESVDAQFSLVRLSICEASIRKSAGRNFPSGLSVQTSNSSGVGVPASIRSKLYDRPNFCSNQWTRLCAAACYSRLCEMRSGNCTCQASLTSKLAQASCRGTGRSYSTTTDNSLVKLLQITMRSTSSRLT